MTKRTRAQGPPDDDGAPQSEAENVLPLAAVRKLPPPRPRIARLITARACVMELSRVYRAARTGQMQWADAARAAYVIRTAADLVTGSDIEERLERLEGKTP